MKRHPVQQHTERRISAALRLVLVAVLLMAQIALVFVLSYLLQQHMFFAYTLLELLAIVYALRVYTRPGSTSYKFGWILLILALPVVGLILYWLWSGDSQNKHLALKECRYPSDSEAQKELQRINLEKIGRERPQWSKVARFLNRRGFALYQNTKTVYLPSGESYLEDMLRCMEKAEHFIFMEYFIVATGEIWDRMMEVFRRKCALGVEVKIIFDDFGSMMRMPAESLDALRETGAQVKVFNPVHHYVNRLYFNYRDHRKITCVDGNVAYTGGVNIADEYANVVERFGHWKDCGVRMEGEGAWGLTREFLHLWERLGGTLEHEHDYYRPHISCEAEGYCQSVVDGPDSNPVATMEELYLQLISSAQHTLYITTPYLAIDEPMIRALCMAGDSDIDVRLMLPGIPDHKFAYLVAESYLGELMAHHIQVYTYTPGLLHGKSVLVDNELGFVGSVNMDYRSFQLHFECGEMLYGVDALQDLQADMNWIVAQSHAVNPSEWKRRPWYRKILGNVLRLFAMWM